MNHSELLALRDDLREEALRLGFAAAGVAAVAPFRLARRRGLDALAGGRMEGMPWMTARRVVESTQPQRRYPWARAAIALAWPYEPAATCGPGPVAIPPPAPGAPRGRIAAYACLEPPADYHDLLAQACDALTDWLRRRVPRVRAKRFVDHGWAMDRAVAERAGLGFCGKNSCLITPTAGSYVLLAEILVDVPLPPTPRSRRSCGRCRACMPACPTNAIVAPGVIDSRRCISYLTIEHRGPIPLALRPLIGTWAFGCDLCQEACPINARLAPRPRATPEETPATTATGPVPFPDLVELLGLDDDAFRARFRRTAVWRAGRSGLARNAAIALGNAGQPEAAPALAKAAQQDPEPQVREAAEWALLRLRSRSANAAGGPR
jgi:epoxyqueuosine reductase